MKKEYRDDFTMSLEIPNKSQKLWDRLPSGQAKPMTRRTQTSTDSLILTRYALLSALRRRGLIPRENSTDGSVTVEFGNRTVTVLRTDDGWVRHIPGHSGSPVLLARHGAEENLARQLARELLDRLP